MAGIQVGGIVSGLDTNSLIDKMMQQVNIPIDRMKNDYEYKNLEKSAFTDFNEMLGDLKSDLLSLRLESTFKTKSVTSSNNGLVTASASTSAAAGKHSIIVDQVARNAQSGSSYTRVALAEKGSNFVRMYGRADDSLEGVHDVTVAAEGAKFLATDEMTVSNVGLMSKTSGGTFANVDADGNLTADISGDFTINYVDSNGNNQTLTVNDTFGTIGDDINKISTKLENQLNAGMNSAMGTNNTQYVSVRSDYSGGNWNFSIYETTVDDYQIEIAGTDAGSIRDEIGFAEASTPTTSSVSKIEKYFLSDTLANLRTKMTDVESGLVGGIFYEVNGDLTEGTFSFAQDASLKVAADTYTSYYTTEKLATGASLNTTTKGLENAGFAETVSGDTNGTFTINDTQITIDDYSKITVNELIGKINASGAGVTATYDSANDKFTLTSNTPGSGTIDVGGFGDTSNILQILKLDFASNPEADLGSTEGSINSSETLANAGLSLTPVSGTFTINGVSIYVDASEDSLSDLMEKVNQSGAGVTMSYDSVSDKVALKSDTINAIEVGSADDSSNILEVLNLTDDTNVSKTIGAEGQRAIVTVDGTQYVRDSNSISDIINGVTFDINGTSSEPVSLNVEVDTDKGVETIAKLIAHYNSVMEKLNVPEIDEDEEDKYKVALTDTDKESMSESDIETYEEKYKQYNTYDIIRKSSEFRNLDVIMRKHFFAERSGINDRMNSMSDLGIKVAGDGDIDIEKYGYLVEVSTDYEVIAKALKENDDFMDKLKNNSDDVFNFFASTSEKYETDKATLTDKDTTNDVNLSSFDYPDLGWARFYDQMLLERYTGSDGMIGNKLGLNGAITNELNRLEKRIEDQQRRAEGQLERYWAEFTAMEKSIAQSQAMAADFSNAGGGG